MVNCRCLRAATLVRLNVLLIGITSTDTCRRAILIHNGYKAWRQWLSKVGLAATGLAALFAYSFNRARPLLGYF